MDPTVIFCSVLLMVATLLSKTWGAPDKELLCGGKYIWQFTENCKVNELLT